VPFVLEPNWQAAGDKEMLVLQVLARCLQGIAPSASGINKAGSLSK
jgi:hypothetical protein